MSHSNSTSSLLCHLRTSICSSCLIYWSTAASASPHLQHHTTFILPYLHHLHIQPSPSCSIASQSSQHLIISSPPSQSIIKPTSSLHQDRIPYFPSSKYWCYPSNTVYTIHTAVWSAAGNAQYISRVCGTCTNRYHSSGHVITCCGYGCEYSSNLSVHTCHALSKHAEYPAISAQKLHDHMRWSWLM